MNSAPLATPDDSPLWRKLVEVPRPMKVVDFPRTDHKGERVGQIGIRVLSQSEQIAAFIEAYRFSRRLLKDAREGQIDYEAVFSASAQVEVLYRACRDPEKPQHQAFRMLAQIRALGSDEIKALFEHYETALTELRPDLPRLDKASMMDWVRRLVADDSAASTALLNEDDKNALILAMARRIADYETETESK